MPTPLSREEVYVRLEFAARRLDELLNMNGGYLPGANQHDRLECLQEFFFHLTGALDVLAQYVNEQRNLGLDSEDVNLKKVAEAIPAGDSLRPSLQLLCPKTTKKTLPPDPYSDEGYIFRA